MPKVIVGLQIHVLNFLADQGVRGVSQMDALRALGTAGGSFTKRISELRRAGYEITRTDHRDPITKRRYGRYVLSHLLKEHVA